MSKARDNHYVPQWYQEGFFDSGRLTLAYLDLDPPKKVLDDGRIITHKDRYDRPTSRCFQQMDLYSTYFGAIGNEEAINDGIERYLFGRIDARGAKAVRAFAGTDVAEWTRHFQTLFEYIDIQKIRTPKGLDWLKTQYRYLNQNDLMTEMQGIRAMHCTIWAEGVREIVSARGSTVKFLVTDHPVTIYNHAVPPDAQASTYPNDPSIALKASQTIFPLNADFCLIFSNLEYAKDPSTGPLEKRTFARNFRNSLVRTDTFIRTRELSGYEVSQVNCILKARARRFVAAGQTEWLYPEQTVASNWSELGKVLLPPSGELFQFGGETYVRFEDGTVRYQDAFGRREGQREFLRKEPPVEPLRPGDQCGCGSGIIFRNCCRPRSLTLRPTWAEKSIRERNLMLQNGIGNVLDLHEGKDWLTVRRELTDEKISTIYRIYEGLWPEETDLLQLLPKPDGRARAIYTGSIHPSAIVEFALGASLYFGELLIEHPFINPRVFNEDYSPVKNPKAFRQDFLKAVLLFLNVMPLVELGVVNLFPDPCDFDLHLREQMWGMARSRMAGTEVALRTDPRMKKLMEEDTRRLFMTLSKKAMRAQLLKMSPAMDKATLDETVDGIQQLREHDQLALLQDDSLSGGKKGGQMNSIRLAPNFELSLYLAQATGASIVTDNTFRWSEIRNAARRNPAPATAGMSVLAQSVRSSAFAFPQYADDVEAIARLKICDKYPGLMSDTFKYLSNLAASGAKSNWEAHLNARFSKAHASAQVTIKKTQAVVRFGRVYCLFPYGGIQDNTVNRLLLMSNSDRHLPNVPMAFFIEEWP